MRWIVVALLAAAATAQDAGRPRHNSSFVPDDDETVRGLMVQAEEAAAAGNAAAAAERLQTLLSSKSGGVVALKGRELFVSPRRWAQIRLLSEAPPFGPEVLQEWRDVHDKEANSALAGAIVSADPLEVVRLLERYPAATQAPSALFALCDAALQRGDPDAARGFLLRVAEHTARSEEEEILATPAYRRRHGHLASLGERRPGHWPTHGGDATRARNGDALPDPASMTLLWETPLLVEVPRAFALDAEDARREHSPVLPYYPVCDERRVYVHLGEKVAVLERRTGKILTFVPDGERADETRVDELTGSSPGVRAVSVERGVLYFPRVLFDGYKPRQYNTLLAWDVERGASRWEVRPTEGEGILARPVFFRGAPALARGRVYAYGAIREETDGESTRKEEAHLLCFEAATGALLWHRFLGYGDTEAAPTLPPQSGLAPAVAAGLVVVCTGLGVAAALDAESGEIVWLFRYDRKQTVERERLSEWTETKVHLRSAWFREPPRIAGDTALLAPFDSEEAYACWLRGRRDPRTGRHDLVQWNKGRTRHLNSLLEYVAGLSRDRIYYVGRRDEYHSREAYQTVVSNPFGNEYELAYGRIPATERDEGSIGAVAPEVFGRPVIAGPVLCVPTRFALYRFDVGRDPAQALRDGERFQEIALLEPFLPPPRPVPEGGRRLPVFGSLVAAGGRLYAATADRVLCYGEKEK